MLISTASRLIVDHDTIHFLLSYATPLLPNVKCAWLFLMDFDGHAVYPCLLIGPTLETFCISRKLPDAPQDVSASSLCPWNNIISILRPATAPQSLTFDPQIKEDGPIPTVCTEDFLNICQGLSSIKWLCSLPLQFNLLSVKYLATSRVQSLNISLVQETAHCFAQLPHPTLSFQNSKA